MERKWMILLLVCSFVSLTACGQGINRTVVGSPVYPESIDFEDHDKLRSVWEDNPIDEEFLASLNDFSYMTAVNILRDQQLNTNYSPVSLYIALALSASGANGVTRDEMLSVLQADGMEQEQLSAQLGNLYRSMYTDNKIGKLKIANSLWLQQGNVFKEPFIKDATTNYYSSLHQVDFTDVSAGKAMAKWVAENTENVLIPEFAVNPQQMIALINTVYFNDEWVDKFQKSNTKADQFYLENGSTVTCDFMHRTYEVHGFVKGDGFTKSSMSLKNGGSVSFVLPDEGKTVDDLLTSSQRVQGIFDSRTSDSGKVIFQIPKYAFASSLTLKKLLEDAGMKSAFSAKADFTNMTDNGVFISDIIQQNHISIDEKGVEAAAFTKIDYAGSAPPNEKIAEMILDRPFLYGITASNGALLFIGVCKNPQSN